MHSSVSLSLLVRVPSTVLTSVNGHHVNLEEEARKDSVKIFLVFCNTPVSSIAHNFCALMVRSITCCMRCSPLYRGGVLSDSVNW